MTDPTYIVVKHNIT